MYSFRDDPAIGFEKSLLCISHELKNAVVNAEVSDVIADQNINHFRQFGSKSLTPDAAVAATISGTRCGLQGDIRRVGCINTPNSPRPRL